MAAVRSVRRPATATTPAFDLAYVRTGPWSEHPLLIIPGGPGLASVLPYRDVRRWAAAGGLDVVMVEHRGVGLSRRDTAGGLLPASAMRIRDAVDDLVAVLDAERIDRAIVVGASYGSYLASALGAWHPERVHAMLLDSALQSAGDLPLERAAVRGLYWDGGDDVAEMTRLAALRGVDERILLDVVRAAHELHGPALVQRLLARRLQGRRDPAWHAVRFYATRDGSPTRIPRVYDFDLAGTIGFRELGYGLPTDGRPFDPALTYAHVADRFPPFEGEPLDLRHETSRFAWPLVLLLGSRDLRTPAAVARRTAQIAPHAVVVEIDNGHSALDAHPLALVNAARLLARGRYDTLPAQAADLNALPRRGVVARFARALGRLVR